MSIGLRSITLAGLLSCLILGPAFALGLSDLTNQDASRGIKGALTEGVTSAIAKLGLINGNAVNIETYVTAKALDGLYLMIGEQEHAIRQNPAAAGSAIVSKVFGALR
jgi:hypothetical protein